MKRILTTLTIGLMVAFNSIAQKNLKVDLDVFPVTFEYVQLPETKLPDDKRTYKVTVNNGTDYDYAYSNQIFAEKIFLNGSKVDEANAAVKVEVQLNNLILTNLGVKEEPTKDANGNVTKVTYKFGVKIEATGKYIIIYNGIRKEFPLKYANTYNGSATNVNETYSYYSWDNQRAMRQNHSRTFADQAINSVSNTLNAMYGYRVVQKSLNFQVVNNETNPDFAQHQETFKKVKEVLSQIQYTTDVTTLREELKASIEAYESIKNKYSDPEDRKHKKMRYASHNNVLYIYYILDMFDEATKEADALIANGFDENQMPAFKSTINSDKALLKTSGLTIRHIEIDPLYIR
jgi:hypothetical protein